MNKLLLSAFFTLLLAGCSSDDSSGSGVGTGLVHVCVPGQQVACACVGTAVPGAQLCSQDGASYSSCQGCPNGPLEQGGAGGVGQGGQGGFLFGGQGGSAAQAGQSQGGKSQGGQSQGGKSQGGSAGQIGACQAGPDEDHDKDGWSISQGDCNDCDPTVNPGAFDFAGNQIDEDCDGTAAQAETVCDQGLAADAKAPNDVAHALGLCRTDVPAAPADPRQRTWGVMKSGFNAIGGAFLQTPIQSSLQFGILPAFGPASKAREGSALFALSSGVARATGQPGFPGDICGQMEQTGQTTYPPGFPKMGSCGMTGAPFDGVAFDMEIRVPTNAHSFSFDYRFFSCEYPMYTCQMYNDVFAVLMGPSPLPAGDPMADATNSSADIAFQTNANGSKEIIGVNNQDFLRACKQDAMAPGYVNCKSDADLAGSGFEKHAASSWVKATVPVEPGSTLSLRFAIWDSGDGVLDSTALVDHFAWHAETAAQVISEVQTTP